MVEIFDYEPGTTIVAAPYDFRLAPSKLQERDYFFRSLMVKIELTVETQRRTKKLAHPGLIVMAHSMGTYAATYAHVATTSLTTFLRGWQVTTSSGISWSGLKTTRRISTRRGSTTTSLPMLPLVLPCSVRPGFGLALSVFSISSLKLTTSLYRPAGAPQAFEGIMSGVTFGLPRISPELAREMASTYVRSSAHLRWFSIK